MLLVVTLNCWIETQPAFHILQNEKYCSGTDRKTPKFQQQRQLSLCIVLYLTQCTTEIHMYTSFDSLCRYNHLHQQDLRYSHCRTLTSYTTPGPLYRLTTTTYLKIQMLSALTCCTAHFLFILRAAGARWANPMWCHHRPIRIHDAEACLCTGHNLWPLFPSRWRSWVRSSTAV